MSSILDRIVDTKWQEIVAARVRFPEEELERLVEQLPPVRDFTGALVSADEIRVIAEVKKASPSAGVIRADFDPVEIAKTYERHGAACLSVLTDEHYFQGRLHYLPEIRAEVRLPLLRKDFMLDRYQFLESRLAGADAVLLIAEILPGDRLAELYQDALKLGLHVLVELHDAEELSRVLDVGATLIGINNRDLRTFETRLEHTLDLMPKIPSGVRVVCESGIKDNSDMERLKSANVRAVLVGESLMRSPDIGSALDALRGVIRTS